MNARAMATKIRRSGALERGSMEEDFRSLKRKIKVPTSGKTSQKWAPVVKFPPKPLQSSIHDSNGAIVREDQSWAAHWRGARRRLPRVAYRVSDDRPA